MIIQYRCQFECLTWYFYIFLHMIKRNVEFGLGVSMSDMGVKVINKESNY